MASLSLSLFGNILCISRKTLEAVALAIETVGQLLSLCSATLKSLHRPSTSSSITLSPRSNSLIVRSVGPLRSQAGYTSTPHGPDKEGHTSHAKVDPSHDQSIPSRRLPLGIQRVLELHCCVQLSAGGGLLLSTYPERHRPSSTKVLRSLAEYRSHCAFGNLIRLSSYRQHILKHSTAAPVFNVCAIVSAKHMYPSRWKLPAHLANQSRTRRPALATAPRSTALLPTMTPHNELLAASAIHLEVP